MNIFNECRFIEKLLRKRRKSRQSFKTAFKKPELKPIEINFSKKNRKICKSTETGKKTEKELVASLLFYIKIMPCAIDWDYLACNKYPQLRYNFLRKKRLKRKNINFINLCLDLLK